MNIAILVPVCSRQRTYNQIEESPFFKSFYPAFLNTKEEEYTYTFFIGYDDDDEFYKSNRNYFQSSFNVIELNGCQHAPAKAWNKLAKVAYDDQTTNYDYFFQIGDDIIIETPGWSKLFIDKLRAHNNIGVVGPCNMKNYNGRISSGNPFVIENAFVHRTHLDIFGYFFHPSISNWFCDDWITRIYKCFFSEIQTSILSHNTMYDRYVVEDKSETISELVSESVKTLKPKRVMSFCIFGDNPKYCLGMIKNLEQISKIFLDFETWIYVGKDVPKEYIEKYKTFNNIKIIQTDITGLRLTTYRLFPLDNPFVELLIVRDADSRFGHRDIWCINNFLNTDYCVFSVRDHPWHGEPLMLFLTGFRKLQEINIQKGFKEFYKNKNGNLDYYQTDQEFAKEYIYNKYQSKTIVYTEFIKIEGENVSKIDVPRIDDTDFCGNVYLFDKDDNEYVGFNIYGKV
jgi:hypothetical protein